MNSSALWSLLLSDTLALYIWPVVWPHLFLSSVRYLRFGLRCRLSPHPLSWSACCLRSADRYLNLIVDVLNKVSCIIAAWPDLFLYLRFGLRYYLASLDLFSACCSWARPIAVLHSHWMIVVPSIARSLTLQMPLPSF